MSDSHPWAIGALVVAVLGVSSSAILVRWSEAPSDVIAFYRVLFTLALVAPVAWWRHREEFALISRGDLAIAGAAGVALAVHFVAWFESLNWTSVAASVTLVQTQPVFVAVGAALLLGERVDRRVVAGIVTAVVGAWMLTLVEEEATLPAGGDAVVGNGLALLGAVVAAAYLLVGRSLRQRISVFPYVTVVYAACVGTLLVAVAVDASALFGLIDAGGAANGSVVSADAFVGYPAREWLLFGAMAVGPGLLGHTVVNWALEHVRSTLVSVSLLGEPVGATILGVVLLGEIVTIEVAASMGVVLLGIYLTASSGSAIDESEAENDEPVVEAENDGE